MSKGNINLNLGGLLGAVGGGIIASIVVFGFMDSDNMRNPYKTVIGILIAGAFAGNFAYGKFVLKEENNSDGSVATEKSSSGWSMRKIIYTILGVVIGIPILLILIGILTHSG